MRSRIELKILNKDTPITHKLYGVLKENKKVTKEDYFKYLVKKYLNFSKSSII